MSHPAVRRRWAAHKHRLSRLGCSDVPIKYGSIALVQKPSPSRSVCSTETSTPGTWLISLQMAIFNVYISFKKKRRERGGKEKGKERKRKRPREEEEEEEEEGGRKEVEKRRREAEGKGD